MRTVGPGPEMLRWERNMTRDVRVVGALCLALWIATASLAGYLWANAPSDLGVIPAFAAPALLLSFFWFGLFQVRSHGRRTYPAHFERLNGRPPTPCESRYWDAGRGGEAVSDGGC